MAIQFGEPIFQVLSPPAMQERNSPTHAADVDSPSTRTRSSRKRPFSQMCDSKDLESAFQAIFELSSAVYCVLHVCCE
jgi:hypothetical protein